MEGAKLVSGFPSGVIKMPPSKSVAHRAVICAALAGGKSELIGIEPSQDITATLRCMDALCGGGELRYTGDVLDCGESGSTLRFLIPIAALLSREVVFTGGGRLMDRPLTPYLSALGQNGAEISQQKGAVAVRGPLRPGVFTLPGDVSSQFVSGMLLALPMLSGDSEIRLATELQSASYVDLTLDTMEAFGVKVENDGHRAYYVKGGQQYKARAFTIEGDYSQAAFFLVAGALGCECKCAGLNPTSRQGDRKIVDMLRECGAVVETTANGNLRALPGILVGRDIDISDTPDLAPPLAVLLALCDGTGRIVSAERLRLKESDRLSAIAEVLNSLGAQVEEGADALTFHGVKTLRGGRVKGYNDHRIAMMGALAAIRSDGPVWVEQPECVAKSYPGFWHDFEVTAK